MAAQDQQTQNVTEKNITPKKKRSAWGIIGHFLLYGGWILIVILALAIMIAISVITK